MDQNRSDQLLKMAISQLESIKTLAGNDVQGTPLEMSLDMAILTLKAGDSAPASQQNTRTEDTREENSGPTVGIDYGYEDSYDGYYEDEDDEDDWEQEPATPPEGFGTREAYEAFLEQQGKLDENPVTVAGYVPDGQGGVVEVGNLEESIMDYGAPDEDEDEDEHEETPQDTIRVSLTRVDENELTITDVRSHILNEDGHARGNDVSTAMKRTFGNDYEVVAGDSQNEKVIQFHLDTNNPLTKAALNGIAKSTIQFGGTLVFPRIGAVRSRIKH